MKERTAEAVGDRGINAGWQKLIRLPTTKQPRGVSSFLVLILKENVAPANQMQRKQECDDDTRLSKMHVIMKTRCQQVHGDGSRSWKRKEGILVIIHWLLRRMLYKGLRTSKTCHPARWETVDIFAIQVRKLATECFSCVSVCGRKFADVKMNHKSHLYRLRARCWNVNSHAINSPRLVDWRSYSARFTIASLNAFILYAQWYVVNGAS